MENAEQTKKVTVRPARKRQGGKTIRRPKSAVELRELMRRYTVSALATLNDIATRGSSESARIAAALALLDRGWGKPATAPQAAELPEFVEFKITRYQDERPPREPGEY